MSADHTSAADGGAASPAPVNWLTCRACQSNPQARSRSSACGSDFSARACILRTSPAAAPRAAATSRRPAAVGGHGRREERIASLPRVDLLGGAGVAAFKLQGEAQKVDAGADRRDRPAVHRRCPRDGQGRIGARVGGAAGGRQHRPRRQRRRDPGDVLPAHGDAAGGGPGETEFVFELNGSPYTEVDPVPGAGRRRLVEGRGPLQGRARLRRRRSARHLPPRLRSGGARDRRRQGRELRQAGRRLQPAEHAGRRPQARARSRRCRQGGRRRAGHPAADGGRRSADRVTSGEVIRPISPYVYGVNSQPVDGVGATVRRMGGNRQTAYNWEINASNAGSDYNQSSDDWPCTVMGYSDCTVPGRAVHRLRAGQPQGRDGDHRHPAHGRLRHRRQARRRPRGRPGPQQALEQIGRPEAGAVRRLARSRRRRRL